MSGAIIASIASWVVAVGAAIKVIVEFRTAIRKPLDDANKRIENLEKSVKDNEAKFADLSGTMDHLIEAHKIEIKSLMIMMRNLEDGNHKGDIKKQAEILNDWLVEKGVQ